MLYLDLGVVFQKLNKPVPSCSAAFHKVGDAVLYEIANDAWTSYNFGPYVIINFGGWEDAKRWINRTFYCYDKANPHKMLKGRFYVSFTGDITVLVAGRVFKEGNHD